MARGRISVVGEDGGIGVRGPDGPQTWAAFGVASEAAALADQEPLVITSPEDAEELLGVGPLRDHLVIGLTGTGTSVVVLPLERAAGGAIIGAGTAVESGSVSVTALAASYGLGGQEVVVECVTGGAFGTAAFRLVVNGRPLPSFIPAAAGTQALVPDASAGTLNEGVPTAGKLSLAFAFTGSLTAFVAGDSVTIQYGEPSFASASVGAAVERLVAHSLRWRVCYPSGHVTPAVWTAFDTAIRMAAADGRYVRGLVQLAGPQLISGASAATTTALWNSAQLALTGTPARVDNPRTGAVTTWATIADPIENRDRVLPATYPLAASIAARQSWEPPEATRHGPMITDPRTRAKALDVKAIHPSDITGPQIDSQDNVWLTTLQRWSGRAGVYPTHVRLWGQFPDGAITGSDYIGIERGLVIDEICEAAYDRVFVLANDLVTTGPDGRISASARDTLEGLANGAIEPFIVAGGIAAGDAIATDKDPGILQTSTTRIRLRIQPHGKNEVIEVTVGYVDRLNVSGEVAEEAA
jgi:hypothetical protein